MKRFAPVAVFTYSRPIHTKNTLEALDKCHDADETDLFIFCDNYKNEQSKNMVLQVRTIVENYAKISSYKNVTIYKSEYNKGLAMSIREGVTKIISQYGNVIVIEDDLIVSKNLLIYMNKALDIYKYNNKIWSISGYSFEMKSLNDYPHDIYTSGRACSWGWATWKDRWNKIDWHIESYDKFKFNIKKRYYFSRWGKDLSPMLDYQVLQGINSWAIIWCFQGFLEDMYTIYPKKSLIKNVGADGTGEHQSTANKKFYTQLDDRDNFDISFEILDPDESIRKEFAKRYSSGWYIDMKVYIKDLLLRIGFNIKK